MINYSVTDAFNLRNLCINHNWFTCGSIEQYDKLFEANANNFPIEEIATIIWLCSNEEHSREYILSILIEEKKIYLQRTESVQ